MARDMYSTKQLSERNLFRLFSKNILTGLTENYMFKNNCRFYDFHPASQASSYHPFCFGRLMNFSKLHSAQLQEAISGVWIYQLDAGKK